MVLVLCAWGFTTDSSIARAAEMTSLDRALARIEQLERQMHDMQLSRYPTATAPVATRPVTYSNSDSVVGYVEPSLANVASSEQGFGCAPCADVIPCGAPLADYVVHSNWFSTADLLYLKVHQRGLDFAVSEDGTAFALGDGQVHNLDYDRDVGYRKSIGYRTKTDWAVRFSHASLETDGVAYAVRPDGIGQLFTTRSQPGGAEETETARMFSAFSHQVFDLQVERPYYQNRFARLDAFAGVRWLDVRQRFRYDYNGRDFTNGIIDDVTQVEGLGLRLGSQGSWQLAGFSLFGGVAVGMTFGEVESRFYESNLDDTIVITSIRDEYDQALASLEANVGVSRCLTDYLSISVGYEMSQWFNLSDRTVYTDDIQESTLAPLSQDILMEGLFARTDFVW